LTTKFNIGFGLKTKTGLKDTSLNYAGPLSF